MQLVSLAPAQTGFPGAVPDLVGLAGTLVLLMILLAIAAFVYRSLTGGIDWPTEEPENESDLERGGEDDEWDYY